MNHRIVCLVTLGLVWLAPLNARAEDWPNWRGPNYDGSSAQANLPTVFSPTEKVKWTANLPGPSGATPIIVGDHVLLTSFDAQTDQVVGRCLDRRTGQRRFEVVLGPGKAQQRGRGAENFYAACSPVCDDQRAIFLSGAGDLVAVALVDGEEIWRRNLQEDYGQFKLLWGYASSPLLYQGKLYIQVLHQRRSDADKSYLLVLNPLTGETLHRKLRETEAPRETKDSYATPTPHTTPDGVEILILGAEKLTGHDPETGQERWRFGDWNPQGITHWRHVQSPTAGPDGVIYFSTPKQQPLFALRVQDNKPTPLWVADTREQTNDVPCPLYYQGRLYMLNGAKKMLSCTDPATGDLIWSKRFDVHTYFRASPTAADGKIFLINADGVVFVVQAGDVFKLLHQVDFGGYPARSSIAVAGGDLYIRTAEKLYCIGEYNRPRQGG